MRFKSSGRRVPLGYLLTPLGRAVYVRALCQGAKTFLSDGFHFSDEGRLPGQYAAAQSDQFRCHDEAIEALTCRLFSDLNVFGDGLVRDGC
jgi:hypothetical protein